MKPNLDFKTIASQGNAILGIRGSGKTYTATWLAEQFLEQGVPFVAFDPIGVWRFLKVPGKGKGFKIVVAGGEHGDLPLTPQSAPEIVRAAMNENIPLILDLYSMELSKADWKKIVESAIRLLLYENKKCGLRHVFIEEAAEFCPQRVGPDQGRVYAEVEKLARMGGNASLGYTLINQRAEEVNKAVLELCDCLFLHRQKGRNSLTALEKWLSFADDRAEEITRTLPTLDAGHCWIWSEGSSEPKRVHIPEKQSFHPDRKNPLTAKAEKSALNVSEFVSQLKNSLTITLEEQKANDPEELKKQIRNLQRQLAEKPETEIKEIPVLTENDREYLADKVQAMEDIVFSAKNHIQTCHDQFTKLLKEVLAKASPSLPKRSPTSHSVGGPSARITIPRPLKSSSQESNGAIEGGLRRMLIALAQRPQGMSAKQLGVRSGLSSSSGTFGTYLSRGRSNGWIQGERNHLQITDEGMEALGSYDPLPTGKALLDYWLNELQGGAARMLKELCESYPETTDAETLGRQSNISSNSGTFGTYLSRLRTLELIEGPRSALKASDEFFE